MSEGSEAAARWADGFSPACHGAWALLERALVGLEVEPGELERALLEAVDGEGCSGYDLAARERCEWLRGGTAGALGEDALAAHALRCERCSEAVVATAPQASAAAGGGTRKRFFLGVGSTGEGGELPTLRSVPGELALATGLFVRLGYERVELGLSESPLAADARAALEDWFGAPERTAKDIVVVYFVGHGERLRNRPGEPLFLRFRDAVVGDPRRGGLAVGALGKAVARSPVQHALVALYCCHSTAGVADLSALQHEVEQYRSRDPLLPGAALYFFAAARPHEVATQHSFGRPLVRAVLSDTLAGRLEPSLDPSAVIAKVRPGSSEVGEAKLFGSGERSPLLPNPRYLGGVPAAVAAEAAGHWDPKGRGVEPGGTGWLFSGRDRALEELCDWLRAPDPRRPALVITAAPGSGKSAVLARVVTLSDAGYRRGAPLGGSPPATLPPEGAVDLALWAHQKPLGRLCDEIVRAFGDASHAAGAGPVEALDALARQPGTPLLAIDALDESRAPDEILSKLVAPALAGRLARVLLATRRPHVAALDGHAQVIDLDDPDYFDPEDVTTYALAALILPASSPYHGDRAAALEVAAAVASRAGHNFGVAGITARALAAGGARVDVRASGWQERLLIFSDPLQPGPDGPSGDLSDNITFATFFKLGMDIAIVGRGRAFEPVDPLVGEKIHRREVEILMFDTMRRLEFPDPITRDVTSLAHDPMDLEKIGKLWPQVKRLVRWFVADRHGDRASRTYALGFDFVSASPILGNAERESDPEGRASAINWVRELVQDADALELPTEDIRDALRLAERGLESGTGGPFGEARDKVIEAMSALEDMLRSVVWTPGQ